MKSVYIIEDDTLMQRKIAPLWSITSYHFYASELEANTAMEHMQKSYPDYKFRISRLAIGTEA